MKNLFILMLLLVVMTNLACSMGSKPPKDLVYVRDINNTFFWASEEKGVFITQTCIKRTKKKCKKWKTRTLSVEKDWEYIRSSRKILINENLVIGKL